MKEKKLYRSKNNRMIAGVCGGLADYFSIDPTLLRVIMVAIAVFTSGLPLCVIYAVCALIIPLESPANHNEEINIPECQPDDPIEEISKDL